MLQRIGLLGVLAVLTGCGTSAPYMKDAEPHEVLKAPPPGKVLVNFNRDSGYGGHRAYAFFDGTKFVGTNEGESRVQYVCDPGKHIFIGYLTDSIFATTSVVKADLKADKVYDLIVDIGYFTAQIAMNPLKRGDARRENLADWDEDQDTLLVDPETNWQGFEADRLEDNQSILNKFKSKKPEKKHLLEPTDHRD